MSECRSIFAYEETAVLLRANYVHIFAQILERNCNRVCPEFQFVYSIQYVYTVLYCNLLCTAQDGRCVTSLWCGSMRVRARPNPEVGGWGVDHGRANQ